MPMIVLKAPGERATGVAFLGGLGDPGPEQEGPDATVMQGLRVKGRG